MCRVSAGASRKTKHCALTPPSSFLGGHASPRPSHRPDTAAAWSGAIRRTCAEAQVRAQRQIFLFFVRGPPASEAVSLAPKNAHAPAPPRPRPPPHRDLSLDWVNPLFAVDGVARGGRRGLVSGAWRAPLKRSRAFKQGRPWARRHPPRDCHLRRARESWRSLVSGTRANLAGWGGARRCAGGRGDTHGPFEKRGVARALPCYTRPGGRFHPRAHLFPLSPKPCRRLSSCLHPKLKHAFFS